MHGKGRGTNRAPDSNELVSDEQPSVNLSCTSLHNLGDVNAIVARYVLIADAAGYAESQTLRPLVQLDLHERQIAGHPSPPNVLQLQD